MDYTKTIKSHLRILGAPIRACKGNEVYDGYAVIDQSWKKNKYLFEESSSKIGRYYRNYYYYIGPYDINIKEFTNEDYIEYGGDKLYFIKKDAVSVGGTVQYYTGVLKKIEEGDENVFTSGT